MMFGVGVCVGGGCECCIDCCEVDGVFVGGCVEGGVYFGY